MLGGERGCTDGKVGAGWVWVFVFSLPHGWWPYRAAVGLGAG